MIDLQNRYFLLTRFSGHLLGLDDSGILQLLDMLGDNRAAELKLVGKVLDVHFIFGEKLDNPNSNLARQRFIDDKRGFVYFQLHRSHFFQLDFIS